MRIRPLAGILCLPALLTVCVERDSPGPASTESEMTMYIGTYTRETSAGIYAYRFDTATGAATPLGLAAEVRDPSFLAMHPARPLIYAVSETDDFDDAGSGSVSAFAIDRRDASLEKLNEVSSKGGWPCHLSVDSTGSMLIVANYKGGSVASFPVLADGSLGQAVSFFQHQGQSVHERQAGPHAHSADFSADGRYAFFSDLGLDQIKVYGTDTSQASMWPHDPPHVEVAPGSGPRHFAQHPSGPYAYGLNELSSTVSVYAFDAAKGTLSVVQTVSTLPDRYDSENYTAEIFVHPSGKFVYASNRGHDSLAVFRIDPASGMLEKAGHSPSGGKWPRSFAFDPTGQFLLSANQNSDNIAVFRIDASTGALGPTGTDFPVDAPVCIVFDRKAD